MGASSEKMILWGLQNSIRDFYDDPSVGGETKGEKRTFLRDLKRAAKSIGLDFKAFVAENCTPFEIKRVTLTILEDKVIN